MSIEKRLTDHMAEQAEQLRFPVTDPTGVIERSTPGKARAVATLTAVLIVVMAGLGFWALSDDDGSTEIAAGEADEPADDADLDRPDNGGSGDDGVGAVAAFAPLSITDVTDANSPGSGQVLADGGVYYVLSTAPGRVRFDDSLSQDDWIRITRLNTFYTYDGDGDGGWQVSELSDRFVSDFSVDDGVMYVLSTGTLSGAETAAFGTSSDRGRSWAWQELPEMPAASQVGMLPTGDSTIILASRWGHPDWDEALRLIAGTDLDVGQENLRGLDHEGFAYVEIDRSDPCSVFAAQSGLWEFAEWIGSAAEEEQIHIEEELGYFREEAARQGCDLEIDDLGSLELVAPIRVSWSELGIEIPEKWNPWAGLYRLDGGQLTELELPFDDDAQVGFTIVDDGEMRVSVHDPAAEIAGETYWTTRDGIEWTDHFVSYERYEDEGCCYEEPFFQGHPPVAGGSTFRVYWEDPDESTIAAFEEAMSEATTDEEAMAIEMEFSDLFDTAGRLQRSTGGDSWDDVDPAEFGVDLDAHVISHVQGSPYGVFLFFRPRHRMMPDGPTGSQGQVVVYSNNGRDWSSFETEGDWVEFHSGDGSMLAFDHVWTETEDGGRDNARALLLTPQG